LAAPSSGLINCSYPFLASFAEEGTDGAAASIFFGTCEKLRHHVSKHRRPSEETRSLMYPQFAKERGKLHKFSAVAENESRLDPVDYFILREGNTNDSRNAITPNLRYLCFRLAAFLLFC